MDTRPFSTSRARAALTMVVLGLAGLLGAQTLDLPALAWLCKPIASIGFVLLALPHGVPRDRYSRALLAALVLSVVGDVMLLGRAELAFLLGLGAFLLGHVAFCVAFTRLGVRLPRAALTFALLLLLDALVLRWLLPQVPAPLRVPVMAYVLIITIMVALSGATRRSPGRFPYHLPIAASLFYASDLSVALDRFVDPSARYWLWGLPLYYLAQVLFALTSEVDEASG